MRAERASRRSVPALANRTWCVAAVASADLAALDRCVLALLAGPGTVRVATYFWLVVVGPVTAFGGRLGCMGVRFLDPGREDVLLYDFGAIIWGSSSLMLVSPVFRSPSEIGCAPHSKNAPPPRMDGCSYETLSLISCSLGRQAGPSLNTPSTCRSYVPMRVHRMLAEREGRV